MKPIFIFLFICLTLINLYSQNRDYTTWWIENHGDYAKTQGRNDPRVERAYAVFERVKNAADKAEARIPRLFIVNTVGKPYAMAIPDGGTIINPTTLDICYMETDRIDGDRRLAFILGHELAHLANKDFLHQEAFLALQNYGEKKAQQKLAKYFQLSNPEYKKKELLADQKGALYAAMVGYDISGLFGKKNNFLKYWARQAGHLYSEDTPGHPSFEEREQFIRTQLLAVGKQVELFRAGVLLYQIESFHDSEAAFRQLSKIYGAREVLNNIGACYLNLALHHLYLKFSHSYYRFRFSTAIDYSTTAEKLYPRGEGDYLQDKDISRYLDKAEDYFRMAVDRDRHDRACRYNLAAALILKKEYAMAQAECDFILKKDQHDVKTLNNKAIAFYYYGKEEDLETTQKALKILEKAHQLEPSNFEVLYNLASLKQERNRMAGAKVFWQKYLKLPTVPKDNFYNYIYKKITGTDPPLSMKKVDPPQMPGGIRLGENVSRIERKWGKKYARKYKLGSDLNNGNENWSINLQVIVKENIRVIALGGLVELVEQECKPAETSKEILKKYGSPQKVIHHTNGNFYVYKNNGFSVKEINGKVCSYIWFEKGF